LCREYITAVKLKTQFLSRLTPDKVLNILLHGSLCFDEVQYTGENVSWPMAVMCEQGIMGESLFLV